MPNPTRLYRLTQLRERAGLTLIEMAQRCDLSSKQGRKTVGDWEAGRAVPRASRRIAFMRYLWWDLGLYQTPTLFDEVWAMLVEEWEWEPLSAGERQQLQQGNVEPLTTLLDHTHNGEPIPTTAPTALFIAADPEPAVAPVPVDEVLPTDALAIATPVIVLTAPAPLTVAAAPPVDEAALSPETTPIPLLQRLSMKQDKRFFLFVAILAALALWIGGRAYWRGTDPLFAILLPVEWLPFFPAPSGGVQLRNGGFEERSFAPWTTLRECDYIVHDDPQLAHSGRHFLAIRNSRPGCSSFLQDVAVPLQVGERYQAAVWLRSSSGAARKGRLALWGIEWRPESDGLEFEVTSRAWVCLETTFTVGEAGNDHLRFEIYLKSPDAIDYWIDDAVVTRAGSQLCPQPALEFRNLRLSQPSGQFHLGATATLEGTLKNLGPQDVTESIQLRAWVADRENGDFVDGVIKTMTLLPLLAGETAPAFLLDIAVPFHLTVGNSYFVVVDGATNRAAGDTSQGLLRTSLPFTIGLLKTRK